MKELITKYIQAYREQKQNDINNTLRCDGAVEALQTILKHAEETPDERPEQAAGPSTSVPEETRTPATSAAKCTTKDKRSRVSKKN